jgi:hypothetical protein
VHRVNVLLTTEASLEGRLLGSQTEQRVAGAVEAPGLVRRQLERSVGTGADVELALDRGDATRSPGSRGSTRVRAATTTYGLPNSSTVRS